MLCLSVRLSVLRTKFGTEFENKIQNKIWKEISERNFRTKLSTKFQNEIRHKFPEQNLERNWGKNSELSLFPNFVLNFIPNEAKNNPNHQLIFKNNIHVINQK